MPNEFDVSGPVAFGVLAGYFLEQIPPEEAAGALRWLISERPEPVAEQIHAWAKEATGEKSQIPVPDFLLYGLEKLYVLGQRGLVDPRALAFYLDGLAIMVLRDAAPDVRESLAGRIAAMRASGAKEAIRPSEQAARRAAAARAAATGGTTAATPKMKADKQLSLILERFGKGTARKKKSDEAEAREAAQILTIAATSSTSAAQFEELVKQIESTTGRKGGNVFATLGGGLPSWDLPIPETGTEKARPAQVVAMGKILDLADNPAVALERVRELVTAAVEKFNVGSLAAAMWMFDVAESGIKEKKVAASAVNKIREEAVTHLDAVQIRKYAENVSKHAALRITLDFFPTMRLAALIQQLRGEPRAEKRRALLGIIETHAIAARKAALERLEVELNSSEPDTYYLRNLVYILHRVPRDEKEDISKLLGVLSKLSAKGQNIYVVKEVATALGQIKTEESVQTLTTCLAELEVMLVRSDTSIYPMSEMQKTLDRVVGAIARIGLPTALLTVARHGLKANPALGDTRAQFGILADQDLAFQPAVVAVLLKALKDEVPGKLLGRFLPKKQDATLRLIEALSGTKTPEVDEVFQDIAKRFEDQDLGRAASKVLAKRGRARPSGAAEPAATLSGELAFFGLPSILQSLADMKACGILTITTKEGEVSSRIVVLDGGFVDAQIGKLRGVDAFYETFERPIPGRFAFVPYPPERLQKGVAPQGVIGLLFEAVRRQDELQLMITVVPDDLSLRATGTKPTAPEEEQDPAFMREVWLKASSGATVGEWGSEIPTDSFRIRRLLSHWLESGALAAATS